MKKINLAVFASGSGSNAENLARYFSAHPTATVALIVSNNPNAYVLERATKLGIPSKVVTKSSFAHPEEVLALMQEYAIDYIILAGFLLKVPPYLVAEYPDAIINIHPALLPKYGGKGMYGDHVHHAVLAAGEAESGITIHYVNDHFDEGEVIAQFRCPVHPQDNAAELAQRVHELEYQHYPEVVASIIR